MPKPGIANWLRVITLSILWGGSFAANRAALEGFGPITIATLRISIGGIALLILMRLMGQRLPRTHRVWPYIIGMAAFTSALPFSILGWGQQYVASGFAGITMAAVPLFTMILAIRFVPEEHLTAGRVIGLLLGFAGVAILIGPAALTATTGASNESLARLACLMTAFSYATGSIITRRCPPVPMVALSAAVLTVAALMLWPIMLLAEGMPSLSDKPTAALLTVGYLGLLPTALATIMLVTVVQQAGPTFLTLSNYQVPLWAVIFGALFFGERLPGSFLAALGLILAGLAVSSLRRRSNPRAPL